MSLKPATRSILDYSLAQSHRLQVTILHERFGMTMPLSRPPGSFFLLSELARSPPPHALPSLRRGAVEALVLTGDARLQNKKKRTKTLHLQTAHPAQRWY